MIAELFLVLAGHPSSLFPKDHSVHPSFTPLLHPGEQQCLESLGQIAFRYRRIKSACAQLQQLDSSSRYISALCAAITQILKDEYESLVISTEHQVLQRDSNLVASGSFVPLSSIRATFAEWDAPLAALVSLVDEIEFRNTIQPGPLIDLLLERAKTGVHRIAHIFTHLSHAVERVWRVQLIAFLVHGSVSSVDPLVEPAPSFALLEDAVPTCVSAQSRESIVYVGRAIATVKASSTAANANANAKWHHRSGQKEKQLNLPVRLAIEHAEALESVLPDDTDFDRVIQMIRVNVSEWLWLNVLTMQAVEDAVDSFTNYFLLRNGEFSLSLIREIERLKISRLMGSGPGSMIREQDLNLALLRASLGTSAQHDPALAQLRFVLPGGPLRPLLPSLGGGTAGTGIGIGQTQSQSLSQSQSYPDSSSSSSSQSLFTPSLLGTPLILTYTLSWPLDLFVHRSELHSYSTLFSYLSALRKTCVRVHACWVELSNAQRARRRWTGLGEGGVSVELGDGDANRGKGDLEARKALLRCGWGVIRDMSWFLDTMMGYVMIDVVDVEYGRLKRVLRERGGAGAGGEGLSAAASAASVVGAQGNATSTMGMGMGTGTMPNSDSRLRPSTSTATNLASASASAPQAATTLDFTTLRQLHTTFLDRVLAGALLSGTNSNVNNTNMNHTNTNNMESPAIPAVLASIFELCERFVGQVERWGGDVLPALLFEGSIGSGGEGGTGAGVGELVRERREVVEGINETLHDLLTTFYELLSSSTSTFQQPTGFSTSTSNSASAAADASRSMGMGLGLGMGGHTTFNMSRIPANASTLRNPNPNSNMTSRRNGDRDRERDKEGTADVRRHVERLMLRLDFNGGFSRFKWGRGGKKGKSEGQGNRSGMEWGRGGVGYPCGSG